MRRLLTALRDLDGGRAMTAMSRVHRRSSISVTPRRRVQTESVRPCGRAYVTIAVCRVTLSHSFHSFLHQVSFRPSVRQESEDNALSSARA